MLERRYLAPMQAFTSPAGEAHVDVIICIVMTSCMAYAACW